MAEIKINISNLEAAIARLNLLKEVWSAKDTSSPSTVGGGKAVNEFEKMAQLYKDLNSHMVALAANTASFLSNVKESYQESDKKAASKISGYK